MKNIIAFEERKGICYVSENGVNYTYSIIRSIAKYNSELTEILFNLAEWQQIETIFDELVNSGEIDSNGVINLHIKSTSLEIMRINQINRNFGKKIEYSSPDNLKSIAYIASEVHPFTGVVGLDLKDCSPLTLLVDYHEIM